MSDYQFISVSDAATLLKVSHNTLYKWIHSGRLSASRIGRKWLIPQSSIDALLYPQQVSKQTEPIRDDPSL